ncbi:MAG: T9SS type A sorting domain-containing protein [Bacteroidetes bacterium]|nr:T9SS type A sorting domain-containing protein [Bacteroidota bacterium]
MHIVKTSLLNRNFSLSVTSLVMMFLFCSLVMKAQSPGLSLGKVGVCNNTTVLIPLTGNNLSNIGAITLFINYDSLSLSFNAIENVDPQLTNGLIFNKLSNPPRIAIVWSKTSGANFQNSTLLNLKFDILQKTGNVGFVKGNCEIANIALPPEVLTVGYTDGSIFEATPVISSEPENKTVPSQSNAVFQVVSPNASGYSWQETRNDGILWSNLSETTRYSGTQTNTLTLRQVPAGYDNFMYRCILSSNSCLSISASAKLSVDSLAGIAGQPSRPILHLTNSPNPFSGQTTIEYSVPGNGNATIKIFSMTGQIMGKPVDRVHVAGLYRVEDNLVYLPAGVYFCQYVFKGTAGVYESYRKMIKIN